MGWFKKTPEKAGAVRSDVVDALDKALGRALPGTEIMHLIDPARTLTYPEGGPPIWSVCVARVAGPPAYSLLLTYGMSHVLSPEKFREGLSHEFSLAIPAGVEPVPWADALLRHQCRYILTHGADIKVNDCIPFNGIPMTRIPFPPAHHAMMPESSLVGIVATADPVLGIVATPGGPIEVRRLVGVDALELDRIETWSVAGFVDELRRRDPLLLSPPQRASWMADAAFRAEVDRRAAAEGSDIDSAMFDIAWEADPTRLRVQVPCGRAARRLLDGIHGRIGFQRPLLMMSRRSPPIELLPGEAGIQILPNVLRLAGSVESGPIGAIVSAARLSEHMTEPLWTVL